MGVVFGHIFGFVTVRRINDHWQSEKILCLNEKSWFVLLLIWFTLFFQLDELKSKDRQITQLEKDISVRDGQITKLRHEIEANMDQTKRNNELMRRFATRGLYKKADSLSSLESSSSDSGADLVSTHMPLWICISEFR